MAKGSSADFLGRFELYELWMPITISEHLVSLDESILAVSLFTKQFHIIESATRPGFNKHFIVNPKLEEAGPGYAAAIYGMTRLVEDPFGDVENITVDYGKAKLMLLVLKNDRGFVALVLNKAVNSDYLALKIVSLLDDEIDKLDMVL